jgi:glucuronate isomerase
MNVEVVCTTDDPTDSLEYHKQVQDDKSLTMNPTFRPDRALQVDKGKIFTDWVNTLSMCSNTDITSFSDFMDALRNRHDYFAEMGSRLFVPEGIGDLGERKAAIDHGP